MRSHGKNIFRSLLAGCIAVILIIGSFAVIGVAAEIGTETERTKEDFIGMWIVEYVVSEGYMVRCSDYGLRVTFMLDTNGEALLQYTGEESTQMTWYWQDGRAWLKGYNEKQDVELVLSAEGYLKIEDSIGQMICVREDESAQTA